MKKIVLFLIISILIFSNLWAVKVGKVTNITGDYKLFIKKTKDEKGTLLKKGMPVDLDYFIQSGKNTEAEIQLDYEGMDTKIRIRKNSLIKIVNRINKKKRSGVFLYFGRLWSLFKGKKKNGYAVETFNSVSGVEGTEFEVSYNEKLKQTILKVNSGKVRFSKKKGILPGMPPQVKHVVKGQIGVAEKNKSIKLIKDNSSKDYNYYLNEIEMTSISNVDNETTEYVDDSIVLLSPEEENELFCDDENGIILTLKLLSSRQFGSDNLSSLNGNAYVWIDDCNYYKGKQLLYKTGRPIRVSNISRTCHDVTILCGGYQHTFDLDLTDFSGKSHTEKVRFFHKTFGFRINQPKQPRIKPKDVVADLEIIANGQLLKVKNIVNHEGLDPGYAFTGGKEKVNFYFPISERDLTITIKSEKYKDKTIDYALEDLGKGIPYIGAFRSIILDKIEKKSE
ncbi:FecR domain-containing protein [bacterium]|nr:FecR domain-containing protein [bacterium]